MTERPHREPPDALPKPRWEPPTLTWLGDVRDLVQGANKQSGNADSDGTSVRKPPLPG
jgi:hypothetical protein